MKKLLSAVLMIALVLSLATMLASCGGDESSNASGKTTKTTAAASANQTAVSTSIESSGTTAGSASSTASNSSATPTTTLAPIDNNGNLALNKPQFVSSSVDNWGWYAKCLTDGIINDENNPGWSSNIQIHMDDPSADEWFVIDLEQPATFNRVVLYTRPNSTTYFPNKLRVLISDDNEEFTEIYSYDKATADDGDLTRHVIDFDAVNARYVKVQSIEMTFPEGTPGDGYLFQVGEIEIFNEE